MANPFTNGPFNCCSCPEPPDYDAAVDDPLATYINLCGCPSVAVVCASESKTATLCGFDEFEDLPSIAASIPPKKYRKRVANGYDTETRWSCNLACSPTRVLQKKDITTTNFNKEEVYDVDDCSILETLEEGVVVVTNYETRFPDCGSTVKSTVTTVPFYPGLNVGDVTSTIELKYIFNYSQDCFSGGACAGQICRQNYNEYTTTLSIEDTEADALARAISISGTSCSSLYQLRTTSFSFTQRTATYTATASNLVVGVQYEGCVRIRRRQSYSGTVPPGADTAWYDVEPDTIAAFTPTATEEEVATDEALPNVQGYEYEVVGAYVWPTSAGCDCPTDYVAP